MIVLTFLMMYFDARMFIFLIQDWKMLANCIAITLTFLFSGKQRTEILFRTKAYNILKLQQGSEVNHEEEEETETIKPYPAWKSVILIYELAQTLSLFHTIMFFLFWRPSMYDYYWERQPDTHSNQVMRIIMMWTINTIPPIFMLFDMAFSKILFRLRHFWVGLV